MGAEHRGWSGDSRKASFSMALRPLGWRGDVLVLCGFGIAASYWCASAAGPGAQLATVLLAALVGLCLCLWISRAIAFEGVPLIGLFAVAAGIRLVALQASPLLEDDHYRYLWDGFQTVVHGTPYHWAPSHFFGGEHDSAEWGAVLGGINNPDIPTIYGPVLQGLFAVAYGVYPGHIGPIQVILCGVDLLTLGLLARAGTPMRWLLVYAVHPLVLKEALASAHPDGLLGLLLLLAALAWRRRQPVWLGIVLGLAAATKVGALVVVPFFLVPASIAGSTAKVSAKPTNVGWVSKVGVTFCASLALCYAPFLWLGGADWQALAVFSQQWRFNPLLYRVLELWTPAETTRIVAGGCLLLALTSLWWQWLRHGSRTPGAIAPVDTALVLLLLCSPVVNPWYWLWALPVAVYRGQTAPVVLGFVGTLSYINGSVLTQIGGESSYQNFGVPWVLTWAQLGVGAAFLIWDMQRNGRKRYKTRSCSRSIHGP